MRQYIHTKHRCGHQVWWSDGKLAEVAAVDDCPWCGGAEKKEFPALNAALKIEQPLQEAVYVLSSSDYGHPDDAEDDCMMIYHHEDPDKCCAGLPIAATPDRFADRRISL